MTETETISLDRPAIEVQLRRVARAKKLSLSVSSIDGEVRLSMPPEVPNDYARDFLNRHADWLEGAVNRAPKPVDVVDGTIIPIGGRMVTVKRVDGRGGVALDGDTLLVHAKAGAETAKIHAWLKTSARDALMPLIEEYADKMGAKPGKLTVRDTRSRWGSCSASGALSFSWRLMMAPTDVLEYLAIHECAHLVEMNHSDAFWAIVEKHCPDWKKHRAWLKGPDGLALHRYQFGNR